SADERKGRRKVRSASDSSGLPAGQTRAPVVLAPYESWGADCAGDVCTECASATAKVSPQIQKTSHAKTQRCQVRQKKSGTSSCNASESKQKTVCWSPRKNTRDQSTRVP